MNHYLEVSEIESGAASMTTNGEVSVTDPIPPDGESSLPSLVYGIDTGNLILLPEEVAIAYADEHQRIFALRTYGEARQFEARTNPVPGLDDDDYDDDGPDDNDPYDVRRTPEFENGDWPPLAATIALNWLPEDLEDIGEQVEHFPNYPTLEIDPATESALVATLRQRGYVVRRDDELIKRI